MSKNKFEGVQAQTIPEGTDVPQVSFDLDANDDFIVSHGVQFIHQKAIPSPIGLKDRGDYRRSGELDVQSSNGFLYKEAGCFTGVILGNSRGRTDLDGGFMDPSQARMTLPRFYNAEGFSDGKRIYLAPGDRIFIRDKEIDTKVENFQRVNFESDRDNVLQFPACCVEYLIDSTGKEYIQDRDFIITKDGNIRWIEGARSPGIDPDTKKGRIYSVRYQYEAHWYIAQIYNEVRIGNVTTGGERKEARFPYHVEIVREYVYHNRINGNETQVNPKLVKEDQKREQPDWTQDLAPNSPAIKIDLSDIEEG